MLNKQYCGANSIMQQSIQNLIWILGKAIYHNYFYLESYGTEKLTENCGYLIVVNHISHLDGPAVIAAHGKHLKYMFSLAAKDYFFDRPWKCRLYTYLFNMIPIERNGKFKNCLKTCKSILARGDCILFFPEGTRSSTGEMQPMKLGLGFLVMNLRVPIVPAYISGTFQALPKGMRFPKKHPICVRFGVPLEFSHCQNQVNKEDRNKLYQEITVQIESAIKDLKNSSIQTGLTTDF